MGRQPGSERRPVLRAKALLEHQGRLRIAARPRLKPEAECRRVVQPLLAGQRRRLGRDEAIFLGHAIEVRLLALPARRLVAAPGRGDGDYREQQGLEDLEELVLQLCLSADVRELVRNLRGETLTHA